MLARAVMRQIGMAVMVGLLAAWEPAPAFGYFQDAAAGSRPAAMGEAFVAIADDAHALLFNPAGLARVENWQFSTMYADLYAGLNPRLFNGSNDYSGYHFVAGACPLPENWGSFGAGWTRLYSAFYWENAWALAYARRLWPAWQVDAGVTLKALQWGVTENEYTADPDLFPERQKLGWTCDAGVLLTPYPGLDLGLSAENIRPADMGLSVEDRVPFLARAGAAYTFAVGRFHLEDLKTAVEAERRGEQFTPKLGVESRWFQKAVAVRAGVNSDSVSGGFGLRFRWPSLPLALTLDYAISYPFQVADTLGSHRLEMTVMRVPPPPARPAAPVLGPELPPALLAPATGAAEAASPTAKPVEPSRRAPAAALPEGNRKEAIVIGYESDLLSGTGNVQGVLRSIEVLENRLRSKTGLSFEKVGFSNPKYLLGALETGELDIVVASDALFKQALQKGLAEPFLTYSRGGRDSQRFCLAVRDDHVIESLADLADTRLGFLRWDSLALLKTSFFNRESGFRPEGFFKEIRPLKHTRDAVVALQLSDVDAVRVPEDIESGAKQMGDGILIPIKVLATSAPIPNTPVFIRKHAHPAKAAKLRKLKKILLQAHYMPEGRAFLRCFNFQKLVPFPEGSGHQD